MEVIKIPKGELNEMKQFYQEELEKSIRRLKHIQSMLDKLGDTSTTIQVNIGGVPEIAEEPIEVNEEVVTTTKRKKKQKPGPKSEWSNIILKRLRQLDRPVTYNELISEVMMLKKLPEIEWKRTESAIRNVAFRLRNKEHKVDTINIGTKEKYIALRRWCDAPGVLKKEYLARIQRPEKPKKPGRPPKK